MARGIIYHIGLMSNIADYDCMNESYFYDKVEALGVDNVFDQNFAGATESVVRLVTRLWDAGFKVKLSMDPKYSRFYIFNTGDATELIACKSKYFAAAYASFIEKVNKMSLETFAGDRTEGLALQNLIDNKFGDAVYFGEVYETDCSLDSFIRGLTPDTTYYIAPETVLMM